jgi:hypothetical protein
MIDYEQTKADALQQKAKLAERQQEIAKEKSRLDEELQSIQRQLIGLDQILEGLDVATLQVPPDIEPMGFTDHIRMILQQTTVHLLPTQIRDSCLNAGFKGSSLKLFCCERLHNCEKRPCRSLGRGWLNSLRTTPPSNRRLGTRHALLVRQFGVGGEMQRSMENCNRHRSRRKRIEFRRSISGKENYIEKPSTP